ncbi:MAG: hypothetical protein IPJ07_04270 [Acidobacteria bacterium]|nr:hypothetical protein [Acidobacteriota bacterium]
MKSLSKCCLRNSPVMPSARAALSRKRGRPALNHPNILTVYDFGNHEAQSIIW